MTLPQRPGPPGHPNTIPCCGAAPSCCSRQGRSSLLTCCAPLSYPDCALNCSLCPEPGARSAAHHVAAPCAGGRGGGRAAPQGRLGARGRRGPGCAGHWQRRWGRLGAHRGPGGAVQHGSCFLNGISSCLWVCTGPACVSAPNQNCTSELSAAVIQTAVCLCQPDCFIEICAGARRRLTSA